MHSYALLMTLCNSLSDMQIDSIFFKTSINDAFAYSCIWSWVRLYFLRALNVLAYAHKESLWFYMEK